MLPFPSDMGTLTALLLATPIFGLVLTPPAQLGAIPLAAPTHVVAQLDMDVDTSLSAEANGEASADGPSSGEAAAPAAEEVTEELDEDAYRAAVRERARMAKLHRSLGLATWGATTVSVIAGIIQYRNLYGGFASRDENPCVEGTAWLGQGQCSGHPLFHLLSSVAAGGLYWTTFAYSVMMPDPDNASEGEGAYAKNVRLHKTLRWVHVVGMGLQSLVGAFIANPHLIGMDRTNDYDTLQMLSTVHLGVGLVTYAALTWAGYIFAF